MEVGEHFRESPLGKGMLSSLQENGMQHSSIAQYSTTSIDSIDPGTSLGDGEGELIVRVLVIIGTKVGGSANCKKRH